MQVDEILKSLFKSNMCYYKHAFHLQWHLFAQKLHPLAFKPLSNSSQVHT
jgi:hypothetical protein